MIIDTSRLHEATEPSEVLANLGGALSILADASAWFDNTNNQNSAAPDYVPPTEAYLRANRLLNLSFIALAMALREVGVALPYREFTVADLEEDLTELK